MQDPSDNLNKIENTGEDIRLAVFGYRQYNIVHCQGSYYGWPWYAGAFSLEGYRSGSFPAAVAGKSIMEVKNLIDEKLGPPAPEEENQHDWPAEQEMEAAITGKNINRQAVAVRQVVPGYRQYDIVHCQGLYFGWPRSAGEFTWEKYLSRTVLAAVTGKSLLSVKNLLDARLGLPTAEEENQHDWVALQEKEDTNKVFAGKKEKPAKKIPNDVRLLLAKQHGYGFWSDMHDVWAKLLLAEITNRQPIIYWGKDSLYSVDENSSSFEQYFLPVSDYTIDDVVSDKYTYYPRMWNRFNLFQTDPNKNLRVFKDVPLFINSDADVLVCDTYNFVHDFMPWIKEEHPAYGLDENSIYRYIHHKYIKLQPDIEDEIEEFYQDYMKKGPIMAVQARGGSKLNEGAIWTEAIAHAPYEIDSFLKDNPSGRVFLLTDDEAILEQFKQLYGNTLIHTDCIRKTIYDIELCLKVFPDKRRKGIEIIKDTYLACKCDYYLGHSESGISHAISRIKAWDQDRIKLL